MVGAIAGAELYYIVQRGRAVATTGSGGFLTRRCKCISVFVCGEKKNGRLLSYSCYRHTPKVKIAICVPRSITSLISVRMLRPSEIKRTY